MIMDPLFLMTFNMGIAGAAIATMAAKIPGAVIAAAALTRKRELVRLDFKGFRLEKDKISSIVRIGLPTAIRPHNRGHSFVEIDGNFITETFKTFNFQFN